METVVEVLGWVGSLEVLLAYGLNSYQRIRSDSALFYILNLTGGIFLIVYTVYKDALASAFINVVWVLIAAVAIVKLFRKQSTNKM